MIKYIRSWKYPPSPLVRHEHGTKWMNSFQYEAWENKQVTFDLDQGQDRNWWQLVSELLLLHRINQVSVRITADRWNNKLDK
jgi:hypothetical protein